MNGDSNAFDDDRVRGTVAVQYADIDVAKRAQQLFDEETPGRLLGTVHRAFGLHAARSRDDVTSLLRAGAPINGVRLIDYGDGRQHWETPLLSALVDRRSRTARALLEGGADVDSPNAVFSASGDGFAHTALHMVAGRGDWRAVTMLLKAGANVDRQTTLGSTPLHVAATDDRIRVVRLLCRSNADTTIRDFNGDLASDLAGPKTRPLIFGAQTASSREVHPKDSHPIEGTNEGLRLLEEAEAAVSAGDGTRARARYAAAAAAGNIQSMLIMGTLDARLGNLDSAATYFEQAAAAGSLEGLVQRGALGRKRGQVHEALEWYMRAVTEGGGPTEMVYVAAAHKDLGHLIEAQQWYFRAAVAGNSDAMFNLGNLMRDRGDHDEALQWYERAAEAGDADGWAMIGSYHLQRGDFQRARPYVEKAAAAGNAGAAAAMRELDWPDHS